MSIPAIIVTGSGMLILKRVSFPLLLRQQQPGFFECTRQSLLLRCQLCIKVGGHTFEHLL